MRRRSVVVALLCLLAVLPCPPSQARPAPEHTVKHIQQSIQNCDLTSFERYVAINALIDNSLDVLTHHLQSASLNGQDLPPALSVMAMAASASGDSTLRNLLRNELGELIRYGVSSGVLNGQKKHSVDSESLLAPLLKRLTTGPKILRAAGKSRKDTSVSDAWLVPVEIYDTSSKSTYPFTLHLVPSGNDWQVDGIADIDALLTRLEQRAGIMR